jgi:predicted MPP superfamily phosphohydrolase
MLKLGCTGRGRGFSRLRGITETVQQIGYVFSWPARVLDHIPAATRVQVIEHRLPFLPGRAGRPPLRIGFASDLHIGPMTSPALLANAFRRLAEASVDVLALGGDYVSFEADPDVADRIAALVASVPAPVKLAVLGNHDLWARHEVIERALERGGARVVCNAAVRLAPPHDDVSIVCLDEPWTGNIDADAAFALIGTPIKIVLVHAPEALPVVVGRGAHLMMCGHTHGGQLATPWGKALMAGKLGRRWPHGLHRIDDLHLFVSRGLGNSILPLRAFAPPDVALLVIE